MGAVLGLRARVFLLSLFLITSSAGLASTEEAVTPDCEADLAAPADLAKAEKAAEAFRAYFGHVGTELVERNETIALIEAALLAKEHVLLMGPPGNAKSMISDSILGNITDEKGERSYYRIQMTPETTMSETHGPVSPKDVFESGRIVRHYDQGMLFSRNVFIDEIFDARDNARRNILGLLAERQHAQGTEIVPGKIETVIAATNRYIDEVYEKAGDQGPKALLDRFSFNIYVPGEFQFAESYHRIIGMEQKGKSERPKLTFEDLDQLRALTKRVEIPSSVVQFLSLLSYRIKGQTEAMEQAALKTYRKKIQNGENPPPPYRATKYHSPRTLFKASRLLRAFVVRDWIAKGGKRPLTATVEDLKVLKSFFVLSGPNEEFTNALLEKTVNPFERSQLSSILQESKIYDDAYDEIAREMNEVVYKYALVELDGEAEAAQTEEEKKQLFEKFTGMWLDLLAHKTSEEQAAQTGADIGNALVAEFLEQKMREAAGQEYQSMIAEKIREMRERQAKLEAEAREKRRREAEEKRRKEEEERRRKEAEERRARVNAFMQERLSNALRDPDHQLEVVAEFEGGSVSSVTTGDNNKFQDTVNLGRQSLVFAAGSEGVRLFEDGRHEKIEYAKISDPMLRAVLSQEGERQFTALEGGKRFAVQRGNMIIIVNAETLAAEHVHMLNQVTAFVFSPNGKYGFEINSQRNTVNRIELGTEHTKMFNINNLAGFQGHMSQQDVFVAMDDAHIYFTYTQGRSASVIDLNSGAITNGNTNAHSWSFVGMARAPDGRVGALYPNSQQILGYRFKPSNPIVQESAHKTFQVPSAQSTYMDATMSRDARYAAAIYQGNVKIPVVDFETDQVVEFQPSVNNLEQHLALVWIDSQHLLLKSHLSSGKNLYRIYRVKPPTKEELERVAAGDK